MPKPFYFHKSMRVPAPHQFKKSSFDGVKSLTATPEEFNQGVIAAVRARGIKFQLGESYSSTFGRGDVIFIVLTQREANDIKSVLGNLGIYTTINVWDRQMTTPDPQFSGRGGNRLKTYRVNAMQREDEAWKEYLRRYRGYTESDSTEEQETE